MFCMIMFYIDFSNFCRFLGTIFFLRFGKVGKGSATKTSKLKNFEISMWLSFPWPLFPQSWPGGMRERDSINSEKKEAVEKYIVTLQFFCQTLKKFLGKYPHSRKASAYATTRSQFSPLPITDQSPDTDDNSLTFVSVCSCNHLMLQPCLPIHSPTFAFGSLNVNVVEFSCLSFNVFC